MPLPSTTLARKARVAPAWWAAWLIAGLAAAAQGQAPAAAPAAPPSAQAQAEADALILQGLKLREQGKDADALRLFERAHALAPTPRAMAQRALAEQALGAWVHAEAHLLQALAAQEDPWIVENRQALDGALAVIRDHLGSLQIVGGSPGAEVRINGKLAGTLPLAAPLRVVVGRPLLEVTLAGHYPVRREVAIKAGALSTETIELVPVPAPAAVAQPQREAPAAESDGTAAPRDREAASGLPPVVFWTAAGVTAVLGGVTLWSGLNTQAKNDAYVEYSGRRNARLEDTERGYETAHSAQTRTNVLLAATGVAAAATVVIGALFTDWTGSQPTEATSARRASVTLAADAARRGLLLRGSF